MVVDDDEPSGFLSGLRGGWDALLATLRVVLTVLGALLPWLIALGVPAYAVLWLIGRRSQRAGRLPAPLVAAPAGYPTAPLAHPAASEHPPASTPLERPAAPAPRAAQGVGVGQAPEAPATPQAAQGVGVGQAPEAPATPQAAQGVGVGQAPEAPATPRLTADRALVDLDRLTARRSDTARHRPLRRPVTRAAGRRTR